MNMVNDARDPDRGLEASEQAQNTHDAGDLSGTINPPNSTAGDETSAADGATESDVFVVGVGASAGGLAAFEAFFAACSPKASPAVAYVVLQHLAPDHVSILVELIGHHTQLSVVTAEDGASVEANRIYVIPPNRDVSWYGGRLRLSQADAQRGRSTLIDRFFASLAHEKREKAIAVILSGTGSDGTEGVRAIKAAGGLVFVQTPDTAQFDGMPTSALATGLVDCELAPGDIPARLMATVARLSESRASRATFEELPVTAGLQKAFALLLAHTGHDFSLYKPRTMQRRIERRMAHFKLPTIDAYLREIIDNPAEIDALFADMLIGVTSFFRDSEAFRVLESHLLPDIIEGRPAGATIRVWCAGCSTGEEAYSIAMLLHECLETQPHRYDVKIFATDIDHEAIDVARIGRYPTKIESSVPPERLARFFTSEPDGGGIVCTSAYATCWSSPSRI